MLAEKLSKAIDLGRTKQAERIAKTSPSGKNLKTVFEPSTSTAEHIEFNAVVVHDDGKVTAHKIVITPSFVEGAKIAVKGRDYNGIKEDLDEWFFFWLTQDDVRKYNVDKA